jgi:Ca2+-binding EF-hand superfamily protein
MLTRDTSKRNILPAPEKLNAAKHFPNEKFQEARRIFSKYDTEGEGSITKDQLLVVLKDFGHESENANDLVKTMNLENGKMTFTEFVNNLPIIEQQKFHSITEILSTNLKVLY